MTALTRTELDWLAARVSYIGIAGAKRAGKDTLARGLAEALAPIPVDSFAAPIRRFVADLLGGHWKNWRQIRVTRCIPASPYAP